MEFPKGFRFDSDFDLFCKAVDTAKALIQFKALFLLFGFESDVAFFRNYTEQEFDSSNFPVDREAFDQILDDEILYLVNTRLIKGNLDENTDQLNTFLAGQKISGQDAEDIVDLYLKKMGYVDAHLLSDSSSRRSNFKLFTTSKKVLDFDWDICKYVFDDGQEQKYAQLRLSVLEDLPRINEGTAEKPEEVQFVCDRHDIDYLISRLELIRTRLEEDDE